MTFKKAPLDPSSKKMEANQKLTMLAIHLCRLLKDFSSSTFGKPIRYYQCHNNSNQIHMRHRCT